MNESKDILISKIEKKAKLAVSQKKKKRDNKRLIYEYFICSLALIGTILAVIDIYKGLTVWQRWMDTGIIVSLTIDYMVRFYQAEDKKVFFKKNILILLLYCPLILSLRFSGLRGLQNC